MNWNINSSGSLLLVLFRLIVVFIALQIAVPCSNSSCSFQEETPGLQSTGSETARSSSYTDETEIKPTKEIDFPFKSSKQFFSITDGSSKFEKDGGRISKLVNETMTVAATSDSIYNATSSEITGRPASGRRNLPSFENGGVMFFVHIPKAGGTTIRLNLKRQDKVVYHFGRNMSTYKDAVPVVENALEHGTNNGTIHVLEVHALDSPSLLQLRQTLLKWRATAMQNNVDIFFFTILRDPLPYSVSHFNFFHVQKRNDSFEQCNATEDNFLRLSLENPQCQFLAKGERSMRSQKRLQRSVLPHMCLTLVYDTLLDTMDYVGTTEQLTNATWPLLARMVQVPPSFRYKNHRVTRKLRNETTILLEQDNLTASAIHTIHQTSFLDQNLYDRVRRDYPVSMWK